MEKLELKHLSPYLPYKLNIIDFKSKEPASMELEGVDTHTNEAIAERTTWKLNEIKPILRPLSDLTKEIEHNGEKFVPMKVMFFNKKIYRLIDGINNKTESYKTFEILFELHFDVFGLIDKGLAIDINSLNK